MRGLFLFALSAAASVGVWSWGRGDLRRVKHAALALAAVLALAVVVLGDDLVSTKVAGMLVMPTVLLWLGLGVSAIYFLGARRPRAAIFPAVGFVVYGLGGNIVVSSWVLDVFVRDLPPEVPIRELPDFDAIFVLGGGAIFPDGTRTPMLTRWGNRITMAAELQRSGRTRYLVASGGQGDSQTEATAILWRRLGVPDDAILQIPRGDITREELIEYEKMIRERGFQKIALLSSAYHMPRALKKAKELGMDLFPIAVDRPWPEPEELDARFLVPTPDAWMTTEMVLRELLGMAVGR
jgi:uncharacterized SAM-binding protein YcdF (DUF218 family)